MTPQKTQFNLPWMGIYCAVVVAAYVAWRVCVFLKRMP